MMPLPAALAQSLPGASADAPDHPQPQRRRDREADGRQHDARGDLGFERPVALREQQGVGAHRQRGADDDHRDEPGGYPAVLANTESNLD